MEDLTPTQVTMTAHDQDEKPVVELKDGFLAHAEIAADTVGMDDEIFLKLADKIPNFSATIASAQRASAFEQSLSSRQSFQYYPKAIAFSFVLSLAVIMEGYDTSLTGTFYGYPTFQRRFGRPAGDGTYQLTSTWQSILGNSSSVGGILGLMAGGWVAERIGYRKSMIFFLVLMICFIFLYVFAQSIEMIMAAGILCGLPWGAFQTLTTTYAAEISPPVLRPYLTSYVNLCWVTGQFLATAVLRGLLSRNDEWAWRIPYAVQWIWPVPIIVGVLLAPESPWWLVRHGHLEEAKKAQLRLSSKDARDYADDMVNMMIVTNEHESLVRAGASYWDCFRGVNARRTQIACFAWACQTTCGIGYASSITYFLEQVGFPASKSFDFGLGLNAIGWLGTICSWYVMQHAGRRNLYIWGLALMFLILLVVGFLGIPHSGIPAIGYTTAALLMIYVFTYDITVGPVCYCMVSELPSTRLRIKTAALARNFYNITVIGYNWLNPPILNPTAWNLRGKGGFIWGGFCGLSLVYAYFYLPEPRGRSAAELDILFEQKIKARNFAKVKVEPFRSTNLKANSENPSAEG